MKRIRCISRSRILKANVHQGIVLDLLEKGLNSLLGQVFPEDKLGTVVTD